MAFPGNTSTVVVLGTFITPEGEASTGSVTFTASSWLTNSGANVSIPNSSVSKPLGTAGDFSATLPITDDPDISPLEFIYTVSEIVDGVSRSYNISIPGTVAAGGTVYLADLTPVAPAGPEYYSLASSLSIGTVTNVGAGGTPTASITGLAPNQTLDLGIPQGLQGLPGSLAEVGVQQFAADGSVLQNLPAQVPSAERLLKQAVWWIDAAHSSASGQSVRNLGWGGSALDAQCGSTAGADSNDPKYLDWAGENYVYLPGVSGNYLSVPDEAALDITGDIDLRAKVAMDDWTPAANTRLVSKLAASGTFSYEFSLLTTGVLQLTLSSNGTTAVVRTSTVATSLVDGSVQWVRATLDADNGASGHDVQFFTSNDGLTWTQLGATVTNAGTFTIHSGTAPVAVGSRATGVEGLAAGKVYRAQVLDGIDGTPVLDVDCSQMTSGADTSFTALTGQTVTINRSTSGRKAVAVTHPVWLFGTDDYMEVADNDLIDFGASDSFTVLAVVRQWATPENAGRYIGKMDAGVGAGYYFASPGHNTSYSVLASGPSTFTSDTHQTTLALGAVNVGGMVVNRSTNLLYAVGDGVLSSGPTDITSFGSLSSTASLDVGRNSAGGGYQDFEFVAAAIFRRALTSNEISTLTAYFQGRAI